jgi:hypothetical protein
MHACYLVGVKVRLPNEAEGAGKALGEDALRLCLCFCFGYVAAYHPSSPS